jgi:multidrug efflux pump subunit AcrA (membrane-fusion protein)
MHKKLNLIGLLVVVVMVLSACAPQATATPAPQPIVAAGKVVAEGHIVPIEDVKMSFLTRGRVDEVLVKEGDMIADDQVLLRMGDREQADAAVAAGELAVLNAQQDLDKFNRTVGIITADAWKKYMDSQVVRADAEREWEKFDSDAQDKLIDDAKATMEDKAKDLKDVQETFDKYKDLDKDNTKRKQAKDDLTRAQNDYNEAVRTYEEEVRKGPDLQVALDAAKSEEAEAKRKYEAVVSGPDAEDLALLQAKLTSADSQLTAAKKALDGYEIKAPFAGMVTDLNVIQGEMVGAEKWAVQLADFSQWYVDTSDLTELEVVKVKIGDTVKVVADALPDVTMTGVVEDISRNYVSQSGDILYTVSIKLQDVDERMRWGMTVEVTFGLE